MNEVRNELVEVPGLQSYVANFPFISGMSDAPLQVYVTGPDLYELARQSQLVFEQLAGLAGMGDIRMDLQLDRPMLRALISTATAPRRWASTLARLGFLRVLAGGADIAKYSELPGDGERYDIRLAAQHASMRNAKDLEDIYLRGPDGDLVRLDSAVTIFEDYGPAAVNRMNLNFAAEYPQYAGCITG